MAAPLAPWASHTCSPKSPAEGQLCSSKRDALEGVGLSAWHCRLRALRGARPQVNLKTPASARGAVARDALVDAAIGALAEAAHSVTIGANEGTKEGVGHGELDHRFAFSMPKEQLPEKQSEASLEVLHLATRDEDAIARAREELPRRGDLHATPRAALYAADGRAAL
eukprot:CAMPEP_0171083014 /NCGR_PEP_ID=MMETSP0766_2-20121228/17461_1 /TAXON_ID=439317 /ORGANISM="Gambierdiscus australes, Strain CAWD 149" /LENGTH=167 /DNA_ID=CAMNT_0011540423 /DNA_START=284 /DNA_END=784 /DNA_ORIENTATION=-